MNTDFLNTDFFKVISVLADILTLVSLTYAAIYGIINKTKTLTGFVISKFISGTFKAAVLLFVLTFLFKLCDFVYLFSLLLFKESTGDYRWEKGYEIHHIAAYFIFGVFFLTLAWVVGTIIWTGSLNQTRLLLNLFLPKNRQLSLKHFKSLSILSAKYGANDSYFDVADKLQKMIETNILTIAATNLIAGDPILGTTKKLIISYRYDGEEKQTIEIPEGHTEIIKPADT